MRGWSCGLSLLPASVTKPLLLHENNNHYFKSIYWCKVQTLLFPWEGAAMSCLAQILGADKVKHPPGLLWKSLDKLCSHQEVWWGITLLWEVQLLLKILSWARPVFPEMFCLFLKQFLEVKRLNQCLKWRRIISQRGDQDRMACPGDTSSFTSAELQAPISSPGRFTFLVKLK